MEYKNESKTILGAVGATGLLVGGLTSIIATVVYSNALGGFDSAVSTLSIAAAWQSVGNAAVGVGVLATIAYLVTHSFAYDLKFRLRENRELADSTTAAAPAPDHE